MMQTRYKYSNILNKVGFCLNATKRQYKPSHIKFQDQQSTPVWEELSLTPQVTLFDLKQNQN
jgi:ABC-type histidine transport system ATPase subunit